METEHCWSFSALAQQDLIGVDALTDCSLQLETNRTGVGSLQTSLAWWQTGVGSLFSSLTQVFLATRQIIGVGSHYLPLARNQHRTTEHNGVERDLVHLHNTDIVHADHTSIRSAQTEPIGDPGHAGHHWISDRPTGHKGVGSHLLSLASNISKGVGSRIFSLALVQVLIFATHCDTDCSFSGSQTSYSELSHEFLQLPLFDRNIFTGRSLQRDNNCFVDTGVGSPLFSLAPKDFISERGVGSPDKFSLVLHYHWFGYSQPFSSDWIFGASWPTRPKHRLHLTTAGWNCAQRSLPQIQLRLRERCTNNWGLGSLVQLTGLFVRWFFQQFTHCGDAVFRSFTFSLRFNIEVFRFDFNSFQITTSFEQISRRVLTVFTQSNLFLRCARTLWRAELFFSLKTLWQKQPEFAHFPTLRREQTSTADTAVLFDFFRDHHTDQHRECSPGPKSRHKLKGFCSTTGTTQPFGRPVFSELVRSEGSTLVMEGAEVSYPMPPILITPSDTKQHDTRPETCRFANHWPLSQRNRQVVKRSIKRAYARALQHGFSWYKGRSYAPTDCPRALRETFTETQSTKPAQPETMTQCHRRHLNKERFRVLSWNAGGLSTSRLDELKVWMTCQGIDAAFITETRWQYENTWSDSAYHYVHTGDPHQVGQGILCILAKSLCPAANLKWQVIQPGRLVHLQVQQASRSIDFIGCYQHTYANKPQRIAHRARFWDQLEQLLHGLAARNILVLGGDFNCDLMQSASHSGPEVFRWRGSLTRGALHSDNGRFTSLVRTHGLVALNTWSPCLGPTYEHADACSRIDFIMTRKQVADGISKDVLYARDAPFQGDTGHVPMIAQLRRQWFSARQHRHVWGITPQQRRQGHTASRLNTSEWQAMIAHTAAQLTEHLTPARPSDDEVIPTMHKIAIECYQQFFPATPSQKQPTDETTMQIVMTKWQHRRALLNLTHSTLPHLFQAWTHLTQFAILNRLSKCHAKTVRQQRFAEVIQSAQQAAQRHDSHALFTIINKYSPRQSKRKMQLRNPQGHIASPIEETAMLKKHIMDTWKGPSTFPTPQYPHSGMPFTMEELEVEMQKIPATRAVARPCAPGIVWRALAPQLAPIIYDLLTQWWTRHEPFLPGWFRDSWMILIPKPNKPPVTPAALRPLALQEPVSKCIVGLLTRKALWEAMPALTCMPLWAYLPGRSTQDALLRVGQHCREIHDMMTRMRSTPFTRHQGISRHRVAGGLQLFLDIEKAFDTVSRAKLFSRLGELGINPQIVVLLSHWHQQTHYHLNSNGEDVPIAVGRGVRQGCRAAPLLWTGYMWLILIELSQEVSPHWAIQCVNVFADDCQMGDAFTTQEDLHTLMQNIAKTLQLLKRFGLTINPAKCVALLQIGGTAFRRHRKNLTTWRDGVEWIGFRTHAHEIIWIPLARQAKYLGTVISYHAWADQAVVHRVQLSKIAFSRLRRWLTGQRGLTKRQRIQLFASCVYPVMTYGIFSLGLTSFGLLHIQKHMYSMLRQILGNHSYITGQSHQEALHRNRVALPLEWLQTSLDCLTRSLHNRLALASDTDIIHQLDWTHLTSLQDLIQWHLRTGPAVPILAVDTEVPLALHQCQQCQFQTADIAHFRRHCTTAHAHRMNRSLHAQHTDYMLHGLPQCKFCHQKFTSWRTFQSHIQRGCQVLRVGPTECWTDPQRPLASDPLYPEMFASKTDAPVRGEAALTDTDLANLIHQEWGRRILTIVATRAWHHMRKETEACSYLANRCCLCDQFLGRTQDLHRHLKIHHPEFWPHVQAKGIQLSNLYGEETPCPYCQALFKSSHQCPIWVQLALLLVYGGGTHEDATPTQHAMRCEICMEYFQTSETLHAHLVTDHRLPSQSFNPARDTLDGEPVCSHCLTMYDSVESLRSHINQGRCPNYNPDLPTEVVDVQPRWITALCQGQLANLLRDAHVRLQLTLHCMNCKSRYLRASDLSGHLQTAHAKLWSASQTVTNILVELLYDETGCLCNPNVGTHRSHHVCLPLRQMAMQYMRMQDPILYPHIPTEEELTLLYSSRLAREARFKLERAITSPAIEAHWTDPALLLLLRTTCILCGNTMHPAELVIHLHEAHQCGQPIVRHLQQQLLTKFTAALDTDHQCFACLQVFNWPQDLDAQPCTAARRHLVQIHFQTQCPNLLQTAIILGKAAHGRHLRRGHGGNPSHVRADLGRFSTREPVDRQEPETGTECSSQAPKKRRTGPTRSPPGTARQTQPGPGHVTAGKIGPQNRPGHAADEARGHLHLLFQQQRARQLPSTSHASDGDMGPGAPGTAEIQPEGTNDSPEAQTVASAVQHPADQTGPTGHSQGGIRHHESGTEHPAAATGWHMPLFGVGPGGQETSSQPTQAVDTEASPPTLHGHAGSSERHPDSSPISCIAHQPEQRGDAMETAAQHALQPAVADHADALALGNLADFGGVAEAPQPKSEPIGSPAPSDTGPHQGLSEGNTEGSGERQVQDQVTACSQGRTVMEPFGLTSADMKQLQTHVALLTLENPGNVCFANAAILSFMWTTLSLQTCDFQNWGTQRLMLTQFLLRHYMTTANLCDQPWFQDIMRCWGRIDPEVDMESLSQQDAAEFIHVWLEMLATPAFDMRWERRLMENDRACTVDRSGTFMPICLQFNERLAHSHSCDLSALFTIWRQVDGMQAALLTAPVCLCLHVDRCVQTPQGTIHKSECMINPDSVCIAPIFQGTDLQYEPVEYQVIALMSHLGEDKGGHYRSALRLAPTLIASTKPAEWLLTDDWQQPTPVWRIPSWMTRAATVFWLVRTDCIQLHRYVNRQPLQELTEARPTFSGL